MFSTSRIILPYLNIFSLSIPHTIEPREGNICLILQMWCFAWFGSICTIFKKVKITDVGVLIQVKLEASVCNFTKSNTPSWVLLAFLELYKLYIYGWYHIFYPNFCTLLCPIFSILFPCKRKLKQVIISLLTPGTHC